MSENKGQFQPGKSGNPKGRPPIISKELQDEIQKDRGNIRKLVRDMMNLSESERSVFCQKPETPTLVKLLAQIIDKAHIDGDHVKTGWLLSVGYGDMTKPDQPILTPEQMALLNLFEQWQAAHALPDSNGGSE